VILHFMTALSELVVGRERFGLFYTVCVEKHTTFIADITTI